MKNTFGDSLSITLYGESHGSSIGVILDGIAAGIEVDEGQIRHQLSRRRPSGQISTARVETDSFTIESGVYGGYTTGTPIMIRIPNSDTRSGDYEPRFARPGHADLAAYYKYHGYEDFRGGGHFSGRLTAAIVAAGAIVMSALEKKGIRIATHVAQIGQVADRPFGDLETDMQYLCQTSFPVLDETAAEQMKQEILAAKAEGDSVGGVLESVITGLPAGVGEPFFDSVESRVAHALFSIPAVKGVEFGKGFGLSTMKGSQANDQMRVAEEGVQLLSNHAGGVFGGITVGAPVTVRTAVKPTPTISKEQQSVALPDLRDGVLAAKGRHDPCIVHRAAVVADSMLALALADLLVLRFGTDWMA